jgi:lipoate-protein ligase A
MPLDFTEGEILDGPANMARDIELLRRAENGRVGCRVYGWTEAWVTLGRFQSPARDLVDAGHTNWVIRPTGGKAVLHGHDITVGLAVPLAMLGLEKRSLDNVYRAVTQPLIDGLRACGVPARLAEHTKWSGKGSRTADCFAFSSPNDIVDEFVGQKVCGCALRLTEAAVLVQASIPNGEPLVSAESVIRNASLSSRNWDATHFAGALRLALDDSTFTSKPEVASSIRLQNQSD